MKLFYKYMVIFFNLSPTSSHIYPLQAENCDSHSRIVVDEDDNVKSGLKGLMLGQYTHFHIHDVGTTFWSFTTIITKL